MPTKRRNGKAAHGTAAAASSSSSSTTTTTHPATQRRQQQRRNNNDNNSNSRTTTTTASVPRVMVTESLLATDAEKHATSRSLYGDTTARIASNVPQIHDRVRLHAYEALFRSVSGKTVLHLGCGMGLYAMLAARRQAKLVVAIDTSAIVEPAREVARANGLSDRVVFLRGRLSEVLHQLPTRSFDVVWCEWMGALLLNEPLLTDVLYARDHLLRKKKTTTSDNNNNNSDNNNDEDGDVCGVLCPNRSSLHVVGVSDYAFRLDTEEYWSNVYGFTMHPMKALVRREVEVCAVPASSIATNSCLAYTVNLEQLPGLDADECARYEAKSLQRQQQEQQQQEQQQQQAEVTGSDVDTDTTTDAAAAVNNVDNVDNPVEQRWVPSRVAQAGFRASFTLHATRATTLHYLTFYIDASFTSAADRGANFVLGICPGGHNAWTEASVSLHEPLPVVAGECVTGTLHAFTPAEGGGKVTVLRVTARTQGLVAAIETTGEYLYQAY